ncbi:hypothetical protein [Rhodobacter sp. SY28-1]|uniref:hypothetical protein n=1 Tax=Rhodobacter sp. SY28-1 TaxID=2562317 RepID=UPI0010C02E3C|nr:hypothetical protein [Rhodobacter sp. SY28-1]
MAIAVLCFAWLSDGIPGWWKHDGTLVTSKDTLANWLVAVFSFIAAIFLWLTLRATQDMAQDTRRIGELQARAYLDVKLTQVQAGQVGKSFWIFRVNLSNTGQSPASQIYVQVSVAEWGSFDTIFPDLGAGGHFEGGIMVSGLEDDAFTRPAKGTRLYPEVCVSVRFLDVFHETSPERLERRFFRVERIGDGGEEFKIQFTSDVEKIFDRMRKDPQFADT